MQEQRHRYGSLDVLEFPGDYERGPCVVMMHGYGADAGDLIPLKEHLHAPANTTWLFPNAPIEIPIGPGFSGRAWFPIDSLSLEQAIATGNPSALSRMAGPALDRGVVMVQEMLAAHPAKFTPDRIVFGGFSQGALMALVTALSGEKTPKGLILFSGALLDEKIWSDRAKKHAGLMFYQSHGTHDPILPYEGAEKLYKFLQGAGMEGDFQTFAGGHEIPLEVVAAAREYLRGILQPN